MCVSTPRLIENIRDGRYEVARAIRHPNGVLVVNLQARTREVVEGPRSFWLTLDPPDDMPSASAGAARHCVRVQREAVSMTQMGRR
jgi:hypothetical protein